MESRPRPLTTLIHATAPHLSKGTTAVVLSQVPPGLNAGGFEDELRERSPADFYYQVETLIFGRAVERAMQPERFIVGSPDPSRSLPAPLQAWHASFGCPVLVMRLESAELAKIAINFFLVSSVTTTNTLAEACASGSAPIGGELCRRYGSTSASARMPTLSTRPGDAQGGNLERDLVTVQTHCRRAGYRGGHRERLANE